MVALGVDPVMSGNGICETESSGHRMDDAPDGVMRGRRGTTSVGC